jgi:NitT/TauT family transport system ATP-binding protein
MRDSATGFCLRLNGVSKSYVPRAGVEIEAVRAFTLDVAHGEFVALFGPNGCGKTTVLLLIGGFLTLDSGVIEFAFAQADPARSAMVFQDYLGSLYPWRTVLSNAALPLDLQGVRRRQARAEAAAVLERLGFDLPHNAYPFQLSGGQQQMLAIARAWAYQPELLLLDEPFGSLDMHMRLTIQRRLSHALDTAQIPITTVLVSHDVEDALALADRIVVVKKRPTRPSAEFTLPGDRLPKPRDLGSEALAGYRRQILETFSREIAK